MNEKYLWIDPFDKEDDTIRSFASFNIGEEGHNIEISREDRKFTDVYAACLFTATIGLAREIEESKGTSHEITKTWVHVIIHDDGKKVLWFGPELEREAFAKGVVFGYPDKETLNIARTDARAEIRNIKISYAYTDSVVEIIEAANMALDYLNMRGIDYDKMIWPKSETQAIQMMIEFVRGSKAITKFGIKKLAEAGKVILDYYENGL